MLPNCGRILVDRNSLGIGKSSKLMKSSTLLATVFWPWLIFQVIKETAARTAFSSLVVYGRITAATEQPGPASCPGASRGRTTACSFIIVYSRLTEYYDLLRLPPYFDRIKTVNTKSNYGYIAARLKSTVFASVFRLWLMFTSLDGATIGQHYSMVLFWQHVRTSSEKIANWAVIRQQKNVPPSVITLFNGPHTPITAELR
jgi:hypothetical protein